MIYSSQIFAKEEEMAIDPGLLEAFNKVLIPKAEVECVEVELPSFLDLVDQSKSTASDYCKSGMYQRISPDNEISHAHPESVGIYLFREDDKKENPVSSHKIILKKSGQAFKSQLYGMVYNNDKKKSFKKLIIAEKENKLIYPVREFGQMFTGRNKESVLRIVDQAVMIEKKPNQLIERDMTPLEPRVTEYSFFPRKTVPAVKIVGENIEVYLPTGEKVVFNGKTGRPKADGVFQEANPVKPVEVKKGNKTLIYPTNDLAYKGDGLFIENSITGTANKKAIVKGNVNGEVQSCELSYSDIWLKKTGYDKEYGKWSCNLFAFEKDEELYKMIREKCPEFKFPKLFIVNTPPETPVEVPEAPEKAEEQKSEE